MNVSTGTPIACSPGWVPTDVPYVLTEDDIRIWNQIDQEDAAADNLAPSDCKGTGRTGNLNWQGVYEHIIIQFDYLATHPPSEREYQIPLAGTPGTGRPGYADIANLEFNMMYEIKPTGQEATAEAEVDHYINLANVHCTTPAISGAPPRIWYKGSGYGPHYFPSRYPNLVLKSYEARPGVISYEYVPKNTVPVPVPVVVPQDILDKLKELIEKLKQEASRFKEVVSEYLRNHPELVDFIKAAAFTAAVAIIVATIVEDIGTAGVGIADDVASFALAWRIVRFAQAL